MKKIKVAIYGSCVNRDIFLSKINKNYKNNFEVVLFLNHTTLLSLTSAPVKYKSKDLKILNWRNKEMVEDEFQKKFLEQLNILKPDLLLVDFYTDAAFQTIKDKDTYITVNLWKTIKTKHYHKTLKKNTPFTPSKEELTKAIKIFKTYIDKNQKMKVILNKIKPASNYIDYNFHIQEFRESIKKDNEELTYRWKLVEKLFEDIVKPIVINEDKIYDANQNHVWGLSSVHFDYQYYADSLKKLKKISSRKIK